VSGPDATNMTETVRAIVDPCITPFGTTTLVAGCESLQKESIEKPTSTFPAVSSMVTGIWNMVTRRGGTSHIVHEDPPVTAVRDIPLPPRLTQPPPLPLSSSLLPPPPPLLCLRPLTGFPERISADRTDVHMNDLGLGCANHAPEGGGGWIGTLPRPSRAEAI
jgi:hypothetical protein